MTIKKTEDEANCASKVTGSVTGLVTGAVLGPFAGMKGAYEYIKDDLENHKNNSWKVKAVRFPLNLIGGTAITAVAVGGMAMVGPFYGLFSGGEHGFRETVRHFPRRLFGIFNGGAQKEPQEKSEHHHWCLK